MKIYKIKTFVACSVLFFLGVSVGVVLSHNFSYSNETCNELLNRTKDDGMLLQLIEAGRMDDLKGIISNRLDGEFTMLELSIEKGVVEKNTSLYEDILGELRKNGRGSAL